MNNWLSNLCGGAFMPHGQCYLWQPELIGLHVVADGLIALSYFSIPVVMLYFVRRRPDLPYPAIFLMFGAFIVACGTTHLMEIVTIWQPVYWVSGGIKFVTAAISLATAVALIRIVPAALELPGPAELRRLNATLEERVRIRTGALTAANEKLRHEIAQRQEAEVKIQRLNLALEQRVAELQTLFDLLPVGVGISRDADCREIRANHAFAAILGLPADANASLSAPAGEGPASFRIFQGEHPLGPAELPMQRAARENTAIHQFEETIRRNDGAQIDVVVNAQPLRDERGAATGVIATFQDITALKSVEQELRLVVEVAPYAIVKLDESARITLVNSQAMALFGYAREELLGQSAGMLIPERFREDQMAALTAGSDANGAGAGREWLGRRKDGSAVPVEIGLNPIRTLHGPGVLVAIIDITHRKRAEHDRLEFERRLLETQKLESVGVLASGIAHDFNNLLTAVLGNAGLVRQQLGSEQAAARRMIGEVELAAQRASDLCRQLLAYAGKGQFVIQPLDLNRLIREHVPLLKLSISKLVDLQLDLAPTLRPLHGDDTQLRQVLMNLVINASEAMGDRTGTVVIRTRVVRMREDELRTLVAPHELTAGWFVSLEVIDNGSGMTPETVARIFEPFFTTKFIGRGLGLASLIGIMRRHKAGVMVDSNPGQGTRFQLLFPARDDSTAPFPSDTRSPFAKVRGRGSVLVVDDEAGIRDFARDALAQAGFEVEVAGDGEEAIALVKAAPVRFAAVLLDLSMPKLDGENTLLALRLLAPRLPVILTSGFNEHLINQRFLHRGLAGFLPKPFTPEELVTHITEAIRQARQVKPES